jgi:hypothetical protein
MKRFSKGPGWAFKIFASLCFSQVKEQLTENLIYHHSNPQSFIYNGQLFAFIHNRSLIADELSTGYGTMFN